MTNKEILEKKGQIKKQIKALETELRELEKLNSGYFIGVVVCGDGNYWDEFYHLLGYRSEESAKEWLKNHLDGDDIQECDSKVFMVDEPTYMRYMKWKYYTKIKESVDGTIFIDPDMGEFKTLLDYKIDESCPVKYPNFMHVVTD